MSELPNSITSSGLWSRLSSNQDLAHGLIQLRANAAAVGAKVSEVSPGLTDHSVSHMDALWGIADVVFTPQELAGFTTGEAFVLSSAFYTHDLGLALAATPEGRRVLEESEAYRSCIERLASIPMYDENKSRLIALRISARATHSERADQFADSVIPGIDRFLLEPKELRNQWADYIGKVAASHHWTLRELDSHLGSAGRIPAPGGETLDLGFLACALRIVDYAHINAGRAPQLERLLRAEMADDSLVHWLAQEFISGPTRDGQHLAYASMRPLRDVDAWWVFYEMANGLDREITAVSDYLAERTVSSGRFSLEGVKGVKSPTAFSKFVRPGGFSPVDIRFRPDSMTRLVDLLGGRQLYGNDRFAPLRELLQNARDAIHLQRAVERASEQEPRPGQIDVRLESSDVGARISISDDGVGMSAKTVTTYLLGIASDFWRSQDFYSEYPKVTTVGFSPVGRFGIGFLSVFMLGDDVEVETQRLAGVNLSLRLRGVGKRGALQERPSALRTGTTIRVSLPVSRQADFEGLARIIQAKAPMLDVQVRVAEMDVLTQVEPGWWKEASQEELTEFLYHREAIATLPLRERRRRSTAATGWFERQYLRNRLLLRETPNADKWPGNQPEVVTDAFRVIATPGHGRVVLCSKGFALSEISVRGVSGLAEVGEVEVNAARSLPIGFDEEAFRDEMLRALWPQVITATNNLAAEGSVPARFSFLYKLADVFGRRILSETSLPWIGVQQPPGNTVLLNHAELSSMLATSREIFVAYGSGPWGADYWVRTFHPDAGATYQLVVIPTWGGPSVRSRPSEETGRVDAPLEDHFVPAHAYDEGARSQLGEAHLLLAVLEGIGSAWGVNAETLRADGWSRQNSNVLGRLKRG